MKTKSNMTVKLDGRKARWFDCNWNNINDDNACEKCQVCLYLNWLDWVGSVGKPEGSHVEYNKKIEEYLKLKTKLEKYNFIKSL